MSKYIIVFLVFNISQCGEYNNWENRYWNLKNKTIEEFETLEPINEASMSYNFEEESHLLGFFDCTCATCALNLISWEEKLVLSAKRNGYSSLIILNENIDEYIIDLIRNKKYLKAPVFLDKHGVFKDKNNINFIDGDNAIVIRNKTIDYIQKIEL
jgi:hypothetical protein